MTYQILVALFSTLVLPPLVGYIWAWKVGAWWRDQWSVAHWYEKHYGHQTDAS